MLSSDRVPSGVPDVDALLGGLILGDNVVWVLDDTDAVRHLEDAMLAEAVARGEGCFYVTGFGGGRKNTAALQTRLQGTPKSQQTRHQQKHYAATNKPIAAPATMYSRS
jgi:hypothetical protein